MIIHFANAFLSVIIKKENQKQLHLYDAENIPLSFTDLLPRDGVNYPTLYHSIIQRDLSA